MRIAELDEMKYRELLWTHRPLTDFWRVGGGISRKLEAMHLRTMGDVARASLDPAAEELLYKTFGVNAELLIDHAWGWEAGDHGSHKAVPALHQQPFLRQVLHCPYDFEKGRLIVREMTELLALDLVRKRVVTRQMVLDIGYDRESLAGGARETVCRRSRHGPLRAQDPPARPWHPGNIGRYTSSTHALMKAVLDLYDRVVDRDLLIRGSISTACDLIPEDAIPEDGPVQLDMFTDYEAVERAKEALRSAEERSAGCNRRRWPYRTDLGRTRCSRE